MVLLTMTPAILEALEKIQRLEENANKDATEEVSARLNAQGAEETKIGDTADPAADQSINRTEGEKLSGDRNIEPSLSNPKLGNPISHGQVVDLWKEMKARKLSPSNLDTLLRGARVYIPPPKPKAEPVSPRSEYP